MPISALVREQLSPSPTGFCILRHFRALRPPAGLLRLFSFFYNLWSFWSWLPWKFCRKSLRVFTKERKNPWNVHSWPKLKIRNSSHFFRPYNKCLRNKSTGERTWNPRLQVKASVQAIDTRAVRGNKSAKQRGSKFTYHSWSKPSYNSRAQCFVRWLIALKSPQSFRNSLKNVTSIPSINMISYLQVISIWNTKRPRKTINDVIMVTGIIGLQTTRINGIPDILAKN